MTTVGKTYIMNSVMKKKLKVHISAKSVTFIIIAILLLALDLITKNLAKALAWDAVLIPDWIEINGTIANNPGCAFSFLNDHPEIGQPIFITLTFIMIAVMTVIFIFMPEKFTTLKLSIAIIYSGAVGNLVDRLLFRSVRDFIGLNMFGSMVFCNIADFCIVVGAILAVLDLLFLGKMAVFPLTQSAKDYQREQELKEKESKLFVEVKDEEVEKAPVNDDEEKSDNE